MGRRVVQSDPRLDQDRALPEPGADRVEEVAMSVVRAPDQLAAAGADEELHHVIGLKPAAERRRAEAPHRERAADAQAEVVGKDGRHEARCQRRFDDAVPPCASFDQSRAPLDPDGAEPRHVEDRAASDEGLTAGGVSASSRGDGRSVPPRRADGFDHIVDIPGSHDVRALPRHDPAKVLIRPSDRALANPRQTGTRHDHRHPSSQRAAHSAARDVRRITRVASARIERQRRRRMGSGSLRFRLGRKLLGTKLRLGSDQSRWRSALVYRPGVTPKARRKRRVRWLWSAKPSSHAMSAGERPSRRSSLAWPTRTQFWYTCGGTP